MQALIDKLVHVAVGRYARAVWWADREELAQQGQLLAHTALRTYDPTCGVEPERYLWPAIVLGLRRHLWAESAPVSGGLHRPRELRGGLRRASLYAPAEGAGGGAPGEEGEEWLAGDDPSPEELVDEKTWRMRVRARLEALAKGDSDLIAIVLEERRPAEVAAKRQQCVGKVYSAAARLRTKASQDVELYSLCELRKD